MIRILRSPSFRVALAFAAAVTVTTYGVFALVYWQFYNANVATVRGILQDEVRQTIDRPVDRLRAQLELRLTQDLRHLDYVGLYAPNGRLTFGNVARGVAIPPDGKTHLLRAPPPQQEGGPSEEAIFVAAKRVDGGTIVLGRSLVYVDELATAMLRAFATAIVPVILVALLAGTIVSLRASRRLSTIQKAINRVMNGDLHVRLPARGTADDIDELVQAVNLMLDEIVRLINQIKSVGDNIAHDLKAPLAVMRARLDRGLAGASEADLRDLVGAALGDLERAMTTVTALLRISELESGVRRGAFRRVDLAEVCRDAFDLYAPLGEAKGVIVAIDASAPVPVMGDADLLHEAIGNLVDNAIKFTPSGGTVALACGHGEALVEVRDTGPGVPHADRDLIFKRFYRSRAAGGAPGQGLGLSMATTIVELHGFGLRVSDNDPGAIFAIVADPVPPADAASLEAVARQRLPWRRALLARGPAS